MRIRTLLGFCLCVAAGSAMADMDYQGFHVDEQLLGSEQQSAFASADAPSVSRQFDIVDGVGLPPDVLSFLKSVKIVVDPALRGNPGVFSVESGQGMVRIQPIVFEADKPILLHELLHAYHYAVLSLKNPAIRSAYALAKDGNVYPAAYQRAHFLENEKEFFAVTGTIYLYKNIHQPPFNCTLISSSDPAYLAFLEHTFGKHECS